MKKTYVCEEWAPRNEYTTPINETPDYRNIGIIKAVTNEGEKIQVGKITYELFWNEEFQYIISPFWDIVDTLPANVFQGIPGIDMDLRLKNYYRVNYVPVFITERTPGPNRGDLWELMESVGLSYYDRFEWLIRTDLSAACDNLIVERAREKSRVSKAVDRKNLYSLIEEGQYGDEIVIDSLEVLGKNSKECTKTMNRLMHYGIKLSSEREKLNLEIEDYKGFIPVFDMMYRADYAQRKKEQKQGIDRAKEKGVYQGRKKKSIDEELLKDSIARFQKNRISLEEALEITGFSKSTFYRRMREYQSNVEK